MENITFEENKVLCEILNSKLNCNARGGFFSEHITVDDDAKKPAKRLLNKLAFNCTRTGKSFSTPESNRMMFKVTR